MLIALKNYISQLSDNLVFEQNTAATRNNFLAQVNPYLESVQQRQGLYAFKVVMDEEVTFLKSKLTDERVRMQFIDKGTYESQIFIGSDFLFFHMHTNVFLLPDDHPFWKLKYLKKNRENGYFGIIYIYNFFFNDIKNWKHTYLVS